jgi:hypothetical protein
MPDLSDVFRECPKLAKKFIKGAFKINPKISNYFEFKEAEDKWLLTDEGKIVMGKATIKKIEIGMRSLYGNKFDATFEYISKNIDDKELLKCETGKDIHDLLMKVAEKVLPRGDGDNEFINGMK